MFSDEHIRELCLRVISSEGAEFEAAALQLQDALESRIEADEDQNAESRQRNR